MEVTRLRTHTSQGGEDPMVFALASYRHASGHTFLLHRSPDDSEKYSATYAPVGLHAGKHDSLELAMLNLDGISVERMNEVIACSLQGLRDNYKPEFSGELGITGTWQDRERYRFDIGDYKRLPELDTLDGVSLPPEHYVHVSTESDDMVAYTQNAEHGERDRQTRIKLGKYLRKVFPSWSDPTVQQAVIEYRVKMSQASIPDCLEFTTSREKIDEIFETPMSACNSGMTSCMYGKFTDWPNRPYHVYADSPDVAVAYLTIAGEIKARTVVSTKDKEWIRLYSVSGCETICSRLQALLSDAGYSKGDLVGNRLTMLPKRRGQHVLPYIDNGGCKIRDAKGYWCVVDSDDSAEYECSCTDGTGDSCHHTPQCDRCEHDEDDCQCSTCECCEEAYYEERNCRCEFCEFCDGCRSHDGCDCVICEDCDRPVNHDNYRRACQCDRCSECNDLMRDCCCDRCDRCNELETECECDNEPEPEPIEVAPAPEPEPQVTTATVAHEVHYYTRARLIVLRCDDNSETRLVVSNLSSALEFARTQNMRLVVKRGNRERVLFDPAVKVAETETETLHYTHGIGTGAVHERVTF